jgi:hypothetical protein
VVDAEAQAASQRREIKMKPPLFSVLTILLLGICITACGSKSTNATSSASSNITARSSTIAQRYLNDGDNDPLTDEDPDNKYVGQADDDNDYSEDHVEPGNNRYHDKDDYVVTVGRAGSAVEISAITPVVERYYAAVAADDSAKACSMLVPSLVRAIPVDYGRVSGPSYLHGDKTCGAVVSALFQRSHTRLNSSFKVTGVRISGKRAVALLGSSTAPASELSVELEKGKWKVASVLVNLLP